MTELPDKRVDLCLWLLHPHDITPQEARQLHAVWQTVPIIPVISKVVYPKVALLER